MPDAWWEQVGPRRFCTEVLRCLQTKSVAVCFPQFSVEDLLDGIDSGLPRLCYYWDAEEKPDAYEAAKAEMGDGLDDPIEFFLNKTGVVVVKNIRRGAWASWQRFVEAYLRKVNSISRRTGGDSPRFLLLTRGVTEEALRPVGVDLKILLYKSRVSCVDVEQYCRGAMESRVTSPVERQVKAAIIAQLALWDKGLADWLCFKDLSELVSPAGLLQRYAEQRRISAQSEGSWHNGTKDWIDGQCRESSLLLAAKNDDRIFNRVWRGQLKVLMPFIEERRCDFVDFVREHLPSVPQEANIEEFEFCKLGWLISNHLKCEQQAAGQVYHDIAEAFGLVRNELAHRKPASAFLLDRMFTASERLDTLLQNGPLATAGR
jgi:hypothetical protein